MTQVLSQAPVDPPVNSRFAFIFSALIVLTFLLTAAGAHSQTARGNPPENAWASDYGRGWACDPGSLSARANCP